MSETDYLLYPIGFIHSPLKQRKDAPKQGREGAPDVWLDVTPRLPRGLIVWRWATK